MRCIKSLNKANKQHRKRSIKQVTGGKCYLLLLLENGGYIMEIKRYLGFTDGIKEPRKTKVENELSASYRYNGQIYNAVTFLCMKLLEDCYPEKEENYQYYKRNGELSKPKTLYMYMNPDGKCYFELNKTQYDFVCHLLENGLNTEESILAYDKADIERVEALKKAEQEEKARQEAEERKRSEERERMKRIIAEETQYILQEEKEIVDSIFLDIYGKENSCNYSLVALIHNFDDPYCKEEIISRLHNDNKASIKIFECITGLKLPKSYKERKMYLEGLTLADFKEMTEYKPREKKVKKEIQEEEFYISERMHDGMRWTKVLAEPFTKYGVDMFIRCSNGNFSISIAEAGMKVCDGRTKTECINKREQFVDDKGIELFLQMIKKVTNDIYNAIGLNPRYKNNIKDDGSYE